MDSHPGKYRDGCFTDFMRLAGLLAVPLLSPGLPSDPEFPLLLLHPTWGW
jgi:hypothetical protein